VKKHLLAYLLYLFGMMFSPVSLRLVEQIVDDHLPTIPNTTIVLLYMLAHTYRGLCHRTKKTKIATMGRILVVSYEFLQLWSWEYLPISRPHIQNKIHP
jgi:hypothetical protein